MGAKAPEKLKLRRQSCKCEVCGRKFLNVRALNSHRKFVHKTAVEGKRVPIKKAPDLQAVKVVKKKVIKPSESKVGTELPVAKVANKISSKVVNEETNSKKAKSKYKIEFKCPKCVKVFSVYFTAYRHIQKSHCVDKNDQPVSPTSPDLIRPIRMEMHDCCNKYFPVTEEHVCLELPEEKGDRVMCLGCQKTFDNISLFEQHVKVEHMARADCLYFPNIGEFTAWKTDLEAVIKVVFNMSLSNPNKSKLIYHCSHEPPIKSDKKLLCPATLYVTIHKNGYQVLYCKEHFGHTCLDLTSVKYKHNSILPYLKDFDIKNIDSDDHIYRQIKSIINSVLIEGEKANNTVLYSLLNKALEMTLILHNKNQEEDLVANRSMTDDQITKALTEVRTYPAKRKLEVKKEAKPDNNSIKDDPVQPVNKTVLKTAVQPLPTTPLKQPFTQSPSFNDTYKDFVDQNFKNVANETITTRRKKAYVKTKIGQFKVRPSLSPKANESTPINPVESSPAKPVSTPKEAQTNSSLTIKEPDSNSPKQESLSVSPKRFKSVSPKIKTTPLRLEYKLKPDFKYEVKEQENDCNILILKI